MYEDFDDAKLLLVKRFMVTENLVDVDAFVSRPVLSLYRDIAHQINLKINYGSFPVENPYNDIQVFVMQNGRQDNIISGITPLFDKDNSLIYDDQTAIIFPGGNEFRWFDTKSLRYQSPYIQDTRYEQGHYHVYLFPEEDRKGQPYFFNEEINGKYFIEVQEETDNDTDADYTWVHFQLPMEEPSVTGNYYIFGALTNWKMNACSQMTYDYEAKTYRTQLFLKQGYYNYHIVFREEGSQKADLDYVEGNHYETENDYLIFVYFAGTMSRYQRLIGYQVINSLKRN